LLGQGTADQFAGIAHVIGLGLAGSTSLVVAEAHA